MSPEGNALPPRLPGQKIIYEKANICKAPVVCSAFATGVVCAESSAERRKAARYSTSLKLRNVGRYKAITLGIGAKPLAAGRGRGGVPPRAEERWVFKMDLGLAYLKTSVD